jgi:hypothetical protein
VAAPLTDLAVSIKNNRFKATVQFSVPDSSCTVTLKAASSQANLANGTVIFTAAAGTYGLVGTAKLNKRMKKKSAKIFMQAVTECSAGRTSTSLVKSVNPANVTKGSNVNKNAWIAQLAGKFQ